MKRNTKRFLSLALTLTMSLSMSGIPTFATDVDSEDEIQTTESVSEDAASEAEPSETVDSDAEDAEEAAIFAAPAANAVSVPSAPNGGTVSGQPFPATGTNHYRIPSLITTSNGTLLAAADIRWGSYKQSADDTANIDTIVSRSTDGGASWTYAYANYIADNGDVYDSNAAVLIDPAMVQANDGTIYMLVDLFPGQASSGTNSSAASSSESGFNAYGNLKLKANASASSYDYYLENGKIYDNSGTEQIGYTVDAYFNLLKDGSYVGNLFTYSTTYFQPVMTSYLYLTKSSDDGQTWSEPQLINVKNSGESYYIVSPGRGTVTSDGTIIFPCYNSSNQASFISSSDGTNWIRSGSTGVTSSESEIVELTDGTLRMFYRHSDGTGSANMTLRYIDYQNGSWSSAVDTGIACHNNTNLSAISYGKDADGKQIILVSVPGDTSGNWSRNNGRIFTLLVNEDKSVTLKNTYAVNNSAFSYSCLSTSDGSVELLYEKGDSGNITYVSIPQSEVLGSIILPGNDAEEDNDENIVDVALTVGENTTINVSGVNYAGNYQASPSGIADVVVTGTDRVEASESYTRASGVTLRNLLSEDEDYYATNYYILENDTYYPLFVTRTSSGLFRKTYTYNYYYYNNGSYRRSSYQSSRNLNESVKITLYSKTTVDPVEASTSINFTGVSFGVATVKIGDTTYRITVSPIKENVKLVVGSNRTFSNNGPVTTAPDAAVATAEVSNGVLTITGVSVGTTTALVGNTEYTIAVVEKIPDGNDIINTSEFGDSDKNKINSGQKIANLITSVDTSTALTTSAADGASTVTWESEDTSIARVSSNGTVTGVSAGTTTIYAVSRDASGSEVARSAVNVTVYKTDTSGSTRNFTGYVTAVENTTAYYVYSHNQSTPVLKELPVNTLINVISGTTNTDLFVFFAAPDDGYALTEIGSTGGDYFQQVRDENDLTKYAHDSSVTINSAGGSTAYDYLYDQLLTHSIKDVYAITEAQLVTMMNEAVDKETDGGFLYTRSSGGGNVHMGYLSFYSDKLPTVAKKVISVNGESYKPGMTAKAGEEVAFEITVSEYKSRQNLYYGGVTLTDNLSGVVLKDANGRNIDNPYTGLSETSLSTTNTRGFNADKTSAQTYTFYAYYTIQESDLDNEIKNTVSLTYQYKTQYSKGSYRNSASDYASITATAFVPQNIVVDYSTPVTVHYDDWGNASMTLAATGEATYGDVAVSGSKTSGWDITYTPNQIIQGVDTVTLKNTAGSVTYSFNVYPATTVYYEEGFATFGNGGSVTPDAGSWSGTTSKESYRTQQQTQVTGETDKNNFGFDEAASVYSGKDGTNASTLTRGDSLKFDFTGTGVDLFANCVSESGIVIVRIKDTNGNLVKMISMDLANVGSYRTTSDAYNTPFVSISGLTHGTYTAYINASSMRSAGFVFDGFRIYDTIEQGSNEVQTKIYDPVNEDNPDYVELRDLVLGGTTTTESVESQLSQIFAEQTQLANAVITFDTDKYQNDALRDGTTVEKLMTAGPKNELYLWPGMSITFTVNTNREVQIGMRSVQGDTVSLTGLSGTTQVTSSVDMFYDLHSKNSGRKTYTIKNTSTDAQSILSITDLKVADHASEDLLCEITADEVLASINASNVPSDSSDTDEPAVDDGEHTDEPAEEEKTFTPAKFDVTLSKTSVTAGSSVKLTAKTSEDVEAVRIGDETVTDYKTVTEKSGWFWNRKTTTYRQFTFTVNESDEGTYHYDVTAVNAEGAVSEAQSVTLTVVKNNFWNRIKFW